MAKQSWEVVEDKTWGAVVEYLEKRMARNRQIGGKFNVRNEELYFLKKAMQEVDSTITNVGATFTDHENASYDTKEGAK